MKNSLIGVIFALITTLTIGQVNVQKTSGTNALTGNIVAGNNTTISATGNGTITATALTGNITGNPVISGNVTVNGGTVTAGANTTLTVQGGSTGATVALGADGNGGVTITPKGNGTVTSAGTTIPANKTLTVTTDNLSVFASTTSSQLSGVISDETGTGSLVFANTPTLVTPNIGAATGTSLTTSGQVRGGTLRSDGTVTMAGTNSRIVAGPTSWGVTNNAGTVDNLAITDAGNATFAGSVSTSAGLANINSASGDSYLSIYSGATTSQSAYIRYIRSTTGSARTWWTGVGIDGGTDDSWQLWDSTGSATRFRVTTAGNATIGGNLSVSGTGTSTFNGNILSDKSSGASIVKAKTTDTASYASFDSQSNAGSLTGYVFGSTYTTSAQYIASSGLLEASVGSLNLSAASNNPIQFWTNNGSTAKMTLTSGGNLGIGTTTPQSKVDIYKPFLASTAISNDNAHLVLSTQNNSTLQQAAIYFQPYNTTGNTSPAAISAVASGNTASSLLFYTNPNSTYTNTPTLALTLDSSQRSIFSPVRAASNIAVKINSSGAATNGDKNYLLFGHNGALNAGVYSQIDNTTTGAISLVLATGTDAIGANPALTLDSSQNATFAGTVASNGTTARFGPAAGDHFGLVATGSSWQGAYSTDERTSLSLNANGSWSVGASYAGVGGLKVGQGNGSAYAYYLANTSGDAAIFSRGVAALTFSSQDATFAGAVKATGNYYLNGAAATTRGFMFQTSSVPRWYLYEDSTAESGSSAGSDIRFARYDDGGGYISQIFEVTRSTGLFTFNSQVAFTSSTPASASATGVTGTITWDSSYIYVCTATNTWKRVAIATW